MLQCVCISACVSVCVWGCMTVFNGPLCPSFNTTSYKKIGLFSGKIGFCAYTHTQTHTYTHLICHSHKTICFQAPLHHPTPNTHTETHSHTPPSYHLSPLSFFLKIKLWAFDVTGCYYLTLVCIAPWASLHRLMHGCVEVQMKRVWKIERERRYLN